MSKIFNIANVYLLFATLITLQDVLYPGGSTLSKMLIMAFVGWSFALWIVVNKRYELPSYFKGLNLLLCMFTIYGIALIFSNETYSVWVFGTEVQNYMYLLLIYLSLLPIYAFYYFTVQGKITTSAIYVWGIILLAASVARFYTFFDIQSQLIGEDEITNNYGYLFVGFLPLLIFYSKKPILQYILLAICAIMVVISMKRGAALVFAVCLLPFAWHFFKNGSRFQRIFVMMCIVAFIIGGWYFIQYMLSSSDYLLTRIEDTLSGNSSDRDVIREQIWAYYNDAPFLQQMIGGGANYTLKIAQNYAHNDWLEILTNQGLFGVLIYLIYWIRFYRTYKTCKRLQPENEGIIEIRTVIFITMLASFTMTLFSMSYANLSICTTMALGIALGRLTIAQTQAENSNE